MPVLALVASVLTASALAVGGAITGWGLTFALVAALVVWPQVAEQAVSRRRPRDEGAVPLEWAGLDAPLTDDEVRAIDARLGLEEVSA